MNMHSKLPREAATLQLCINLAALAALAIAVPALAQRAIGSDVPDAGNAQVKIKLTEIKDITPTSGRQMFAAYCAVCHGALANGDGRAASALTVKPTDLTLLSANNRGKFPRERVQYLLTDVQNQYAHGSADMPLWCPAFRSLDKHAPGVTSIRVHNLVSYLETLQAPNPKAVQAKVH